jgi:4-diphosphocytidyl-2-C-methyl-D-erythritol kinase
VIRAAAPAKLNLALVVGALREDGKHEVATVLQRIDLGDRVALEPAPELAVGGFAGDTLVRAALERLASAAGVEPRWRITLTKRIPVAAGLAGGSSDAATALRLANETLPDPLPPGELHTLAAQLGADVPFFLADGPQLGRGDGSELSPLDLPQDYWIVLVLPRGATKESTAAVYARFDERGGADGATERLASLERALAGVARARDLAALPPNDLASSPLADELRAHGAFRADVTGAGTVVYGLFLHRRDAVAARRALRRRGRTWLTVPVWYGWRDTFCTWRAPPRSSTGAAASARSCTSGAGRSCCGSSSSRGSSSCSTRSPGGPCSSWRRPRSRSTSASGAAGAARRCTRRAGSPRSRNCSSCSSRCSRSS